MDPCTSMGSNLPLPLGVGIPKNVLQGLIHTERNQSKIDIANGRTSGKILVKSTHFKLNLSANVEIALEFTECKRTLT